MNFWAQYFITVGLMLTVYCAIKLSFVENFEWFLPKGGSSDPCDGKGIDAEDLAKRMEQLRGELRQPQTQSSATFKRAQLVENKREQMAKLAFFQPQPKPPEPQEHEEGLRLLMV